MSSPVFTAPPNTGTAVLGKTLTSLLYEASARHENPRALNQPKGDGWEAVSLVDFRRYVEETALGLHALGLQRGDRAALFMESDVYFCIADMGCLLAGVVDVPMYLTHTPEALQYLIEHAEVRALFVSTADALEAVADLLFRTTGVRTVIVAEMGPHPAPALPDGVELLSLEALRERGRKRLAQDPDAVEALKAAVGPHDLATILYTSGTTGEPKGVMLTHENISFNALTSFSGLASYRAGAEGEVAISFLPLTHIFARTLQYGFLAYGTSVYFTTPDRLVQDLQKVKPTVFATVPRVLEKVYSRIRERAALMTGVKKKLLQWALDLAGRYELGQEPSGLYALKLKIADALVFKKWREALGGRVRFIICGGAALSGHLANTFAAAGINVLQGYGLTETSPVISYNRPGRNRAGTVGEPLPGVEVRIADDGEILTRGPHIMKGYYKADEKTREVIDEEGWFHTGDVGEVTPEGFLRITDRKKDLFKLSTGKYVMPQPLENRLIAEPLVEQAVVVGAGYKFCAALIFPEQDTLRVFARSRGLDPDQPIEALLKNPTVVARYQELVDRANEGMDPWSTIKRFALIPAHLTIEDGILTPKLSVKRSAVRAAFAREIQALYDEAEQEHSPPAQVAV